VPHSVHVNSYEFQARWRKNGLLLTGHIGGSPALAGVPDLEPLHSGTTGVLLFRLVFRPFTQHHSTAFDHLIHAQPGEIRMIRILLPAYQEFIIRSHAIRLPHHPVTRHVTGYASPTAAASE
jgi:hypothetical protein